MGNNIGYFLLSGLNTQPRLRILSGSASAGGVRFLGGGNLRCWEKSSCLSDAGASSGFFSAVLADFRRLRSQPPTKPQTGQYPEPRRPFRRPPLHNHNLTHFKQIIPIHIRHPIQSSQFMPDQIKSSRNYPCRQSSCKSQT